MFTIIIQWTPKKKPRYDAPPTKIVNGVTVELSMLEKIGQNVLLFLGIGEDKAQSKKFTGKAKEALKIAQVIIIICLSFCS